MGGALQPASGSIGMKLRRTRIRLGMRQVDVAMAVGVDQTTISSVERGLGDPESRAKVSKWLRNPNNTMGNVNDTLLEAAVATSNMNERRALVESWITLYGEGEGGRD